jgi:TetR/AcrR family transcriptional repressor of nem operon
MESQLQNQPERGGLTPKGRATRARIVAAAAKLVVEHGAAQVTLEDIQSAARVSASQLYHYFDDKKDLLHAVIDYQSDAVLGAHRVILERLDGFGALQEWRDMVVSTLTAQHCVGGCPLGSLASALAESDPIARGALARSFDEWEQLLRDGLTAMRDRGELRADTDVDRIAVGILASVQGGLLLSQARRDSSSVRDAVDTSIAYLRTLRP